MFDYVSNSMKVASKVFCLFLLLMIDLKRDQIFKIIRGILIISIALAFHIWMIANFYK